MERLNTPQREGANKKKGRPHQKHTTEKTQVVQKKLKRPQRQKALLSPRNRKRKQKTPMQFAVLTAVEALLLIDSLE